MSAEIIMCPKCGASVDFPIGQEKATCPYCQSVLTKPTPTLSILQRIQEAETCAKEGWRIVSTSKHALSLFDKAIELDPDNVRAWTGKGVALLHSIGAIRFGLLSRTIPAEHMKEAEEALRCFQKACEIGGVTSPAVMECDTLTWRQALALRLGKWNEIYEGRYKSGY